MPQKQQKLRTTRLNSFKTKQHSREFISDLKECFDVKLAELFDDCELRHYRSLLLTLTDINVTYY